MSPMSIYAEKQNFLFTEGGKGTIHIYGVLPNRLYLKLKKDIGILAQRGIESPYSAAFTGGGFMHAEMVRMLPLFMSADRESLVREEIVKNEILHVNSEVSRKRVVAELKRRYDALPRDFWNFFNSQSEYSQKVAMFYVLLKTYRVLFDLHFGVSVKRWHRSKTTVDPEDVRLFFNDLAAKDEFVASWTTNTQTKVRTTYMSILRKAGLMDASANELNRVSIMETDFSYYLRAGEVWFLEACLLMPFEITRVKESL